MSSATSRVIELVETFDRNIEAYRSQQYNETQLRREFIDPFFEELGWDVTNKQGYAQAYKDVIHEDSIKIGGYTKAPDYSFRIGCSRKFFLEAKKPAVDIKDDCEPAYQLRRYAWSAKLPLSVLTDFEEFAVYDCLVKPKHTDRASVARIMYLTYKEYNDRWDEIAAIFSKDAVLKGSFDRFATTAKGKRGTTPVDIALLAELEKWRDELARIFALRNRKLSAHDINFAVQRTIDRILFLRMAEDRGIEQYGQLDAISNGDRTYPRLCELFEKADKKYNSGLFYFNEEPGRPEGPDEMTLNLAVPDNPLKYILHSLYYPQCPYEFSVLPPQILGNVYEQFLGRVIRLTPAHQAKIEEKPEVKKAGGIYYTPDYIVDYIVKNTVGKLCENKTPKEIAKLKILDPACGSGSFLLGAYTYLLNYLRDWYVENNPKKYTKQIYQGRGGLWFLTIAEKKKILLNNIFGVDIDSQAVEVTKLSLLLKVLEDESQESLLQFHERALPDLGDNIKCGNSLIGLDFFDNPDIDSSDDELRQKINAFDWKAEFPEIFKGKTSGFDAIIGNPPWGQKGISFDEDIDQYLRNKYTSITGILDIFRPFVEAGIKLTSANGMFGMVLPDIILLKNYEDTRRCILNNLAITKIDWWGMAFVSAVIDASTIIGQKKIPPPNHMVSINVHDPEQLLSHEMPQSSFKNNPRCVFNLFLTKEKQNVLDELNNRPKLSDFFEIHEGVHSGNIREDLFVKKAVDNTCQPLVFGRDEISPYHLKWNGRYIRLSVIPEKKSKQRYANAGKPEWYAQEKLLVRRTGDYVLAALDSEKRYASNNFFIIFPKTSCSLNLFGLCALLNSKFSTWYFRTIEPRKGRVFAEIKIKHLSIFPVPACVAESKGCQELNDLAKERISLAHKYYSAKTPQTKMTVERACVHLDQRINNLVIRLLNINIPKIEDKEFGNAK